MLKVKEFVYEVGLLWRFIIEISTKIQKKEAIKRPRSRWENNIKILLIEK
jgi:hypothetical protein